MSKYYYVKLLGYVALVTDDLSLAEWYFETNTHVVDGVRKARDGGTVVHGHVMAQSEAEAHYKVRSITE